MIKTRLLISKFGNVLESRYRHETPQSLAHWRKEAIRLCSNFGRDRLRVVVRDARPGERYGNARPGEIMIVPATMGAWGKCRIVRVGPPAPPIDPPPPPPPYEEYEESVDFEYTAPAAEAQA
jgi:hypothetical protein